MHKIVLFTIIIFSFFINPLSSFAENGKPEYRLEVLVKSAKGRLIKIEDGKEEIIRKFPVGASKEKFFNDIPFGQELPVTRIVINPSWTPTKNMYQEESDEIAKGKKISKIGRLRKFKPGDPGNPLGRIAFYFDNPKGAPIRFHGTNQNFRTRIDENGEERGYNVSHGCVRNELTNLLFFSSIFSGKKVGEIVDLVHTRKYHELESLYPIKIKFIKG